MKTKDVVAGYRFPETELTALGGTFRQLKPGSKTRRTYVWIKCDCGTEREARFYDIAQGNLKSCGCVAVRKQAKAGVTWTADQQKICICGQEIRTGKKTELQCATCLHRWRTYKITWDDVCYLLELQDHKCLGCGIPVTFKDCVDHKHGLPCEENHKGRQEGCKNCIRGFLCRKCNNFEGVVAAYIKMPQPQKDFWTGWVLSPSFPLVHKDTTTK